MSKHLSISNNIGQYLWLKIYQKNAEINQYTYLRHGGPSHAKQTIIENQACIGAVSYTHLDVYKRQGIASASADLYAWPRKMAGRKIKNQKPSGKDGFLVIMINRRHKEETVYAGADHLS